MKNRHKIIIVGIVLATIVFGTHQYLMYQCGTLPVFMQTPRSPNLWNCLEIWENQSESTSSYMNKIVPTLDDFKNTLNESQDIETIFSKFGDPHDDIGSGIHIYVYELNDSTEIWIGYADRIMYVQHVDSDGNNLEQLFENVKKTSSSVDSIT